MLPRARAPASTAARAVLRLLLQRGESTIQPTFCASKCGVAVPEPAWARVMRSFSSNAPSASLSAPPKERQPQAAAALITVHRQSGFATITINRPKQLNALSSELVSACAELDSSEPDVKAIIVTGAGTRAFAAGADIKEMAGQSYAQVSGGRLFDGWDRLAHIRKPLIAAVNGLALGGGCELALMCDVVVAGQSAAFGQPELALGVIPGMGGCQRLARLIGRTKAMDVILTGRQISAAEAEAWGLISRVVPDNRLMAEAEGIAKRIAGYSAPVVAKAKAAVKAADEGCLTEGVRNERNEFWACFALADQKEGMAAFVEKRPARFVDA